MTKLEILEVASTWSFWDQPVPESVLRHIDLPHALRDSLWPG